MLSRAQREEGMKQIKEIRRRLRENDWDGVDVDTDTATPMRVKPLGHLSPPDGANPLPPGYKDAD